MNRLRGLFCTLFLIIAPCAQAASVTSYVDLVTHLGTITVGLYQTEAPITTQNFLAYVNNGQYAGTIIHRLQPNFVFQGGWLDVYGRPIATFPPIANEAGINKLSNVAGTIAMARTADPGSATSQFFFNLADNASQLDFGTANAPAGYAVFGRVMAGDPTVQAIAGLTPFSSSSLPFPVIPGGEMVRVQGAYAYPLAVGAVPHLRVIITGPGSVRGQPGGTCQTDVCSWVVKAGKSVKLKAIPARGSVFVGWAGDCVGGDRQTVLALRPAEVVSKSCIAQFVPR